MVIQLFKKTCQAVNTAFLQLSW